MSFCTNCGRPNDEKARFCAYCGSPMEDVFREEDLYQSEEEETQALNKWPEEEETQVLSAWPDGADSGIQQKHPIPLWIIPVVAAVAVLAFVIVFLVCRQVQSDAEDTAQQNAAGEAFMEEAQEAAAEDSMTGAAEAQEAMAEDSTTEDAETQEADMEDSAAEAAEETQSAVTSQKEEASSAQKTNYLAASELVSGQDVYAYHYCKGVDGTYYEDAIGGMTKDIENSWDIDLTSLDDTYTYLDGTALINADYTDVYTRDKNYIRISLDGKEVYEFSPDQGATSDYTDSFHLPLEDAETVEICIKGATTMRLADLAFTNSEGVYDTATDVDPFADPLEKLELVGKGADGDLRVMTAERDMDGTERDFVLAGTTSQVDNLRKYNINGASRFTGTVFRNYNFPEENADDTTGVSIYLDDKLYGTYNETNPELDIPLEGKQTMIIVINGCNYYRIADYDVE